MKGEPVAFIFHCASNSTFYQELFWSQKVRFDPIDITILVDAAAIALGEPERRASHDSTSNRGKLSKGMEKTALSPYYVSAGPAGATAVVLRSIYGGGAKRLDEPVCSPLPDRIDAHYNIDGT